MVELQIDDIGRGAIEGAAEPKPKLNTISGPFQARRFYAESGIGGKQ